MIKIDSNTTIVWAQPYDSEIISTYATLMQEVRALYKQWKKEEYHDDRAELVRNQIDILNDLYDNGEIPSDVHESFVDLLENLQ